MVSEQSPPFGQFFGSNQTSWGEIIALTTYATLRLAPKRLVAINEKVGARDFAFHQHRMTFALPADSVRNLSTDAGLLGENHATAISTQPADSRLDKLRMSHTLLVATRRPAWKSPGSFRE